MIILCWLIWRNKNLTWETLQRKGWQGPGYCVLCKEHEENNYHLFYKCSFALEVTNTICSFLRLPNPQYNTLEECIWWWFQRGRHLHATPIIMHWHVWCGRNGMIFADQHCTLHSISVKIYGAMESLKLK